MSPYRTALKTILLMTFAFTMLPANLARSEDAKSYLTQELEWVKENPKERRLEFTLVRNDRRGNAAYMEGTVSPFSVGGPASSFLGEGTMYYCKSRWGGSGFNRGLYPFDPEQTENPLLALNAKTGQAFLVKGSSIQDTINPQFDSGVLYGFGQPTRLGARYMYVIDLQRVETPIPK